MHNVRNSQPANMEIGRHPETGSKPCDTSPAERERLGRDALSLSGPWRTVDTYAPYKPWGRKMSAVIKYANDTSYDITWDEGEVWALTHTDTQPERHPGQILPYTNGLARATYVSRRRTSIIDETKGVLNVQNLVQNLGERLGPGILPMDIRPAIDTFTVQEEQALREAARRQLGL